MDYDVIVIGAGVGGLSAGASLAAEGFNTLVLEQSDAVGGCASSFKNRGYHFDVGACIIEFAPAHQWFYSRLGLRMEDYVTFLPNDPLYELVDVLSGERIAVPASPEGTAEIIARHSKADARAFLRFMRGRGRVMDEFTQTIFTTPQGRLRDLLRVFVRYPRGLPGLSYMLRPFGCLLEDMFEHPFTRRLLGNYSVIGGLPPSQQSGIMLWDCYAEHEGMFYPRGGMGAVPLGMARALVDVGGELRLRSRVDRLMLEGGRAVGVILSDGSALSCRAVVSDVSATTLYLDMIGEENIPRAVARGLLSYPMSPTCAVGHLALDYMPPMRAQHMMALTEPEMIDAFWSEVFEMDIALPQTVGLVSCPSIMDPDLAPEGHAALSFITMAPRHPRGTSWAEIKWRYLDSAIDMLDALYLPGLKEHIVFKTVATPEDFERRLLIPEGSIYSYSMSPLSQMVFRPSNRSKCVKGLYLGGASSHPSGSVPGAICGGLLAADLAAADLDGRRGR